MAVTAPLTLSNVDASLLPRTITAPIFEKSVEASAVMQLARPAPLALDATTSVPIPMDVPVADWVGQAAKKPLSTGGVDVKQMQAKKVAVLIPVAMEVAKTNAGGLYDQLQKDLPTAFARAFDHAAIHGKTMKGATGPFTEYLAATTNSVALGTASQATGGIWADFVNGMAEVVDSDWDYTGTVADHRLKPSLLLATDTTGRPILVDTQTPGTNMAAAGTLIGEPLAYSRSVSGKQRRQSTSTDTGLRAIGGDWSQAAYGVGMDITVRISDQATYVDEEGGVHSAFQENLVLILAEAYYGFVLGDVDAFVKFTGTPSGS
ncbi:phage major capsid protein [Streptomyces caniscabiei]|uniref:Phage major capsid protein n=1 Tax=Streptomyces caniscabiei TaxID=2746961 RepID=A0A927L3M4_9ACTN|nr:phage major capsid protein [Streptomyces caniscabiei]MBD9721988.1 phage major capsid protein [Streptomyces caniscabiei]MDX3509180.1 phage major capsid protein [Streptomyces caniscabiei]MDX3717067.1 phage major capsid protein [Streptomyces caniscabiei]WEO22935.1 phage major capsid protein [Streptomyces caniscabiei]